MEKKVILEKVRSVIVSVLKHENFDISDDLKAKDVDGWGSLTHMEIITGIEDQFNIKFKLKELNKLDNMGTLIQFIQSKL